MKNTILLLIRKLSEVVKALDGVLAKDFSAKPARVDRIFYPKHSSMHLIFLKEMTDGDVISIDGQELMVCELKFVEGEVEITLSNHWTRTMKLEYENKILGGVSDASIRYFGHWTEVHGVLGHRNS